MEYLEPLIGALLSLIGYWLVSDMMFQKKSKKDLTGFILILLSSVIVAEFSMLNETAFDSMLKIIVVFVIMILFNKNRYKEKLSDIILGTFLVYINLYFAEIILAVFLSIIFEVMDINLFGNIKDSLLINITTVLISFIVAKALKRVYIRVFRSIRYNNLNLVSAIVVILVTITLLLTKTPVSKWSLSVEFITTMSLIVLFCLIALYMLKQKSDIDKVTDKYKKLADYSKNNEGLLEEYRINLHETNNQLIVINNMIPAKSKEAHEYIESLIKTKATNKYYWLNELKYVPSSDLKSFMNFKMIEMVNNKIVLEINISRDLDEKVLKKHTVKDKEDLYNIVGVLLDNAQEAALESKEKAVSIQMYMEKKVLKLIVANTYKGKINLEKIDDYGYSTKGSNRGTGLHIVKGIIEKNKLFEKETTLLDNYFVQNISIYPKNKEDN